MDNEFYSEIFHLKSPKHKNLTKYKSNIQTSTFIQRPLLSIGMHHHIYDNKKKMDLPKQLVSKKNVANPFETKIDDFDKDINSRGNTYFNKTIKLEIISRACYKMWELLLLFDVVPLNSSQFRSAHLSEGPGGFIQATILFRDMFSSKSNKDKYHGITLHSEEKHVPAMQSKFLDYFDKEKPQRLNIFKTYSKYESKKSDSKTNGDITKLKTIDLFVADVKEPVDFVTGDGGFEWKNENNQEQEAFILVIAQIVLALRLLNKNGNFILKIFETYTKTSVKLLRILNDLFEKVYISKPYTSRMSNSEKYLVCTGLLYDQNDSNLKHIIKELSNILTFYEKEDKQLFIQDIFPDMDIPDKLFQEVKEMNVTLTNKQLIVMNEISRYINAQNFFGEDYQSKRQKQIDASQYWTDIFFVKNKTEIDKLRQTVLKK
jgi:23S rRNA U2552 (ribose-2'-O)-methylase RlmE/FtsJ